MYQRGWEINTGQVNIGQGPRPRPQVIHEHFSVLPSQANTLRLLAQWKLCHPQSKYKSKQIKKIRSAMWGMLRSSKNHNQFVFPTYLAIPIVGNLSSMCLYILFLFLINMSIQVSLIIYISTNLMSHEIKKYVTL